MHRVPHAVAISSIERVSRSLWWEEVQRSRLVRSNKETELPGHEQLWVISDLAKGDSVVTTIAVANEIPLIKIIGTALYRLGKLTD